MKGGTLSQRQLRSHLDYSCMEEEATRKRLDLELSFHHRSSEFNTVEFGSGASGGSVTSTTVDDEFIASAVLSTVSNAYLHTFSDSPVSVLSSFGTALRSKVS